jgi:hypothetical protein
MSMGIGKRVDMSMSMYVWDRCREIDIEWGFWE